MPNTAPPSMPLDSAVGRYIKGALTYAVAPTDDLGDILDNLWNRLNVGEQEEAVQRIGDAFKEANATRKTLMGKLIVQAGTGAMFKEAAALVLDYARQAEAAAESGSTDDPRLAAARLGAVSYTHLTLPTICSV